MINELSTEEIQKESFKLLLKIKEIFDLNGWKYYLTYGTLIGAVRHHGFIPWDDDIDLWVPRKDYEAFINYCKEHEVELGKFKLFHFSNCNNYPFVIARFSDTTFRSEYKSFKDFGLGTFVDLYPLDEVDPKDVRYKRKQLRMIQDVDMLSFISESKFKQLIKKLIKPLILIKNAVLSVKSLEKKVDRTAQKYNGKHTGYLAVTSWEFKLAPDKEEDIIGEKDKYLEFNGDLFRVPYNYDAILKAHYGDYMRLPPQSERVGHHFYKIYKKKI